MFDALVSGIFGLAGQSKDRKYAKEDRDYQEKYEDPKAIRKRFESAGFNPMLAYGGNGSSTIAPTIGHGNSTQQLVASVFEGHQQDKIARAQLEQENKRLELIAEDLALRAPDTKVTTRNSGVGDGVRESVEKEAPTSNTRPQVRPTIHTKDRVPVFNPAGDQIMVPQSWAERMGIKPFGYLAAGEYTELVGEIRGEGETALAMGDIATASGAGFFNKKTPPPPVMPTFSTAKDFVTRRPAQGGPASKPLWNGWFN